MPPFCRKCGYDHSTREKCKSKKNFEAIALYWKEAYLNLWNLSMMLSQDDNDRRRTNDIR